MLPRVILHSGASVDGRLDCPTLDVGLYYELTGTWDAEAILSGSNTILAAFAEMAASVPEEPLPEPGANDTRPWLVIVDSRGRLPELAPVRRQPYWRDVIILCSRATPPSHLRRLEEQGVTYIIAGDERVDLQLALETLHARFGVRTVRVDSGGVLNGALLRARLVDEVSVLISPCLVGGTTPRSLFVAPDLTTPDGAIPLRLVDVQWLRGDTVWLRYHIAK